MQRTLPLLAMTLFALPLGACGGDTSLSLSPYDLVAQPGQYDFGTIAVGTSVEAVITMANRANGGAEVGNVAVVGGTGHFSLVESFNGDIGGGASQDIRVVFEPLEEGYWEDTIVVAIVNNEDSDVLEIPLRGHAVMSGLRTWPSLLDFGPVPEDTEEDRDLTVENLTEVDLEIWGTQVDGGEDGFEVQVPLGFEVFPWVVEAGSTLELTVTYEAEDEEGREATLHLLGPDAFDWGAAVELRANICEESADPGWDADGDGVTSCAGDCDDDDATAFPGNTEVGDAVDNDCDGTTDEGTELYDDDGDGMSEVAGDCNDENPDTWSGAEEIADGQDNDCDGAVDEGTTADDSDGDGYTIPAGDCDDTDALVWPGADELEDGYDNDCDGLIDETTSVYDDDGDGYCENATVCLGGWLPGDCNDGDVDAFPGNAETINGADDDCDGIVDNGTDAVDDDGDGYSENGGDCDDGDPAMFPGAPELADTLDNDCDGIYDEGTELYDDDGDGYSEVAGDCNDSDSLINPGASEDGYALAPGDGDGIDNDCDSIVDEGTTSYDDDGDGFSELGGDCDDDDAAFSPAVYDPPADGNDWDCNGTD